MKLRPYQEESLAALWSWFRENPQGAPLLVLPTGAGKSLVLAEMAKTVCRRGPDRRVLILAHRKELLVQNAQELQKLWPEGDIGVYSAGLGERSTRNRVVVAGIQSVYERADALGRFSLVIIDEAHLIPPDGEGRYRTLIAGLLGVNDKVRFAGLTATPYRLGSGMLTESGGIFTAIAYEVGIKRLIDEGFLSPLVTKSSKSAVNLAGVGVKSGEYAAGEMESRFNQFSVVESAVKEIITYGVGRKSWLIFASGVEHAGNVKDALQKGDIPAEVVTGDTPPIERSSILQRFKEGRVRALVNVDVLTTGFNHPGVDLLAVLRGTKSTGLWVQICGRGSRKAAGKDNCLILDYGGNASQHGPIDQIHIAHRKNPLTGAVESRIETPKVWECPSCQSVIPVQARECPDCGYQLIIDRLNHGTVASSAPIISEPEPPVVVDVKGVLYARHEKADKPPSLKVTYVLGQVEGVDVVKVSEWVCLEHDGYAQRKATEWWNAAAVDPMEPVPTTVEEALATTHLIRKATRLLIKKDGKFWRVLKVLAWGEPESGPQGGSGQDEDPFFNATRINI